MSIVPELSSQLGRKDDLPNKELGKKLVENQDLAGIQEAVGLLSHPDRQIQIDCLGVLEQIAFLKPGLVVGATEKLFDFIFGSDNRLIWQSMIILAQIADLKTAQIMDHFQELIEVINVGSVITKDNGIKVLSNIAGADPKFNSRIFPFLLEQLRTCRSKSLPQYAESIFQAVNHKNRESYQEVLSDRQDELTPSQEKRISRILRELA